MKNKKVLVLGGSYLQYDFVEDIQHMGFDVICIDQNPECYVANKKKECFYALNFGDREALMSYLKKNKFDVIVSPANELGNLIISSIAEDLDIPYNTPETVKATIDKNILKCKLVDTNLNVAKSYMTQEIEFPAIIKPSNSSAGRGVSIVRGEEEYGQAVEEAKKHLKEGGEVIIEEYIEGEQYSIETVSCKGKHYIVGVTKEITSGFPLIERSDYTNNFLFEKRSFFESCINDLLNSVGVFVGPCHIELIVKEDKIYIIDFASRSGGWRSRLLKYAQGSDYNKLIIDSYLGEIDKKDIKAPQRTSTVGILMYAKDKLKYEEAKKDGALEESYFYTKEIIDNPTNLIDAYGYFYASYEGNDYKYNLEDGK